MTSFDIITNVISANQNFSSTFSMHWYSNSRHVVASSSSFSRPAVRAPGELARRLLCLLPSIWKYEWGKWRRFLARINSDRTLRKRLGKRSEQRCVVAFEPVMTGWYIQPSNDQVVESRQSRTRHKLLMELHTYALCRLTRFEKFFPKLPRDPQRPESCIRKIRTLRLTSRLLSVLQQNRAYTTSAVINWLFYVQNLPANG